MCIGRSKRRIVPVGEGSATWFYRSRWVITNGFELPNFAHPLEVAHMGSVGRVHTVDIGVDRSECEFVHCRHHGCTRELRSTRTASDGLRSMA